MRKKKEKKKGTTPSFPERETEEEATDVFKFHKCPPSSWTDCETRQTTAVITRGKQKVASCRCGGTHDMTESERTVGKAGQTSNRTTVNRHDRKPKDKANMTKSENGSEKKNMTKKKKKERKEKQKERKKEREKKKRTKQT